MSSYEFNGIKYMKVYLCSISGEKLIEPKMSDLGYYSWKSEKVVSNDSLNFKVLQDSRDGLLFQNRFDRRIIIPRDDPGPNTTKKRVYSPQYKIVVLFDHVVRQRIWDKNTVRRTPGSKFGKKYSERCHHK